MAQPQQQPAQPPQAQQQQAPETKLLWNPENVKDVAESVGISALNDDALRVLTQDVEYRIGQVTVEALRFMRAARRTTLTVGDVSQALKVLDVEPLYGYDSTRPLRYGEASLGPGQPLFYIEDEEIDFEKLINAPLPKVPRDMSFTGTSMPRIRDPVRSPIGNPVRAGLVVGIRAAYLGIAWGASPDDFNPGRRQSRTAPDR